MAPQLSTYQLENVGFNRLLRLLDEAVAEERYEDAQLCHDEIRFRLREADEEFDRRERNRSLAAPCSDADSLARM